MQFCLGFLLVALTASALAYPNPNPIQALDEQQLRSYYELEPQLQPEEVMWSPRDEPEDQEEQLHRVRRQLQLQGGGGGSPRQGFDLSLNGRAPVWQSQNGRHSLDATGQYSQHLGGPYGNSRPNWGAGAVYTFRF